MCSIHVSAPIGKSTSAARFGRRYALICVSPVESGLNETLKNLEMATMLSDLPSARASDARVPSVEVLNASIGRLLAEIKNIERGKAAK